MVENSSKKTTPLKITTEISSTFSSFVKISVTKKYARDQSLSSFFQLSHNENTEVCVTITPSSGVKIPTEILKEKTSTIATLFLESHSGVIASVPVKATFVQGPTLTLSGTKFKCDYMLKKHRLILDSELKIEIQNKWETFTANFSVQVKSPHEALSVKVTPEKGELGPSEKQILTIKLGSDEILTETVEIIVSDLELNPPIPQKITIEIEPSQDTIELQTLSLTRGTVSPRSLSVADVSQMIKKLPEIILKGCAVVNSDNSRYEINLGQVAQDSPNLQWEISLESSIQGDPFQPIEYKLTPVNPDSIGEWFTLSQTQGQIESILDIQKISMIFSTKKVDNYSVILLLENMKNPGDFKTIKINLKVVSEQNKYFSVFVDGRKNVNPLILDYGHVDFYKTYSERSLIISNDSDMPLDFIVCSYYENLHNLAYDFVKI